MLNATDFRRFRNPSSVAAIFREIFRPDVAQFSIFCDFFVFLYLPHQNKKCIEVATEQFLKGRLVLLLEIERPLSISHASKCIGKEGAPAVTSTVIFFMQ